MGLNIVRSSFMSEAANLVRSPRGEARAIFLSKDSSLLAKATLDLDTDPIHFTAKAGVALGLLGALRYQLIVLSDEAGAGFGQFQEQALAVMQARLKILFAECGAVLGGVFWCPHAPQAGRHHLSCTCRRPMPGLIQRASATLGLNASASWVIGNTLDDVEAGKRAGCRAILVHDTAQSQWEPLWRRGGHRTPEIVVHGLDDAARVIANSQACVTTQVPA